MRGGGHSMQQQVPPKMEAAFGADFSSVRIHVGPQASRIGAAAFTTGNNVYFAPGRYQPHTHQGQRLLGHELAHVMQQRQGRVRASSPGVAVIKDPALEAEADRLGARAAAHVAPPRLGGRDDLPVPAGNPDSAFHSSAVQPSSDDEMEEEKENLNDEDYEPAPTRPSFGAGQAKSVVQNTAHKVKQKNIRTDKYANVWTCKGCARPLAYEDANTHEFETIDYSYVSKGGTQISRRALELDHHPETWARRKEKLSKLGRNKNQLQEAYRDEKNLRALCLKCNQSHDYEGHDLSDYDSDSDSGPGRPRTPDKEPLNKGRFSSFFVK